MDCRESDLTTSQPRRGETAVSPGRKPGVKRFEKPEPRSGDTRSPGTNLGAPSFRRFCEKVRASCSLLRQLPARPFSQLRQRDPQSHEELSERGVPRADLVESHLVNQFLEHQRIGRKQIDAPL